jgi:hypothetical protein
MPNFCENELVITGEGVQACLEFIKGEEHGQETVFDFNKVVPYPEKYRKMDEETDPLFERLKAMSFEERAAYLKEHEYPKDGYNSGGHEWCIEHWGTRSSPYEVQLDTDGDSYAELYFTTAWSPPEPVIMELSRRFPELRFQLQFWEGGAAYAGVLIVKAGATVVDHQWEYSGSRGG